jgi:hypothetical protein
MKKIISIFDNNPWYAAFIYPIVYFVTNTKMKHNDKQESFFSKLVAPLQ